MCENIWTKITKTDKSCIFPFVSVRSQLSFKAYFLKVVKHTGGPKHRTRVGERFKNQKKPSFKKFWAVIKKR